MRKGEGPFGGKSSRRYRNAAVQIALKCDTLPCPTPSPGMVRAAVSRFRADNEPVIVRTTQRAINDPRQSRAAKA